MNTLRKGLPEVPARMRSLPIEDRGYPVPWFVDWIDGKPDFRVMDRAKWVKAVKFGNCWLCGEVLGRWRTFVMGPMCTVTRTTSEPANHLDCARFAATACPFMILPKAQYRTNNLPQGAKGAPGMLIDRNPGVVALWTTESFRVFKAHAGNEGHLISVGDARAVEWYCQGREATRAEVDESVMSGLPALTSLAHDQSQAAELELQRMTIDAQRHFPVGCSSVACGTES